MTTFRKTVRRYLDASAKARLALAHPHAPEARQGLLRRILPPHQVRRQKIMTNTTAFQGLQWQDPSTALLLASAAAILALALSLLLVLLRKPQQNPYFAPQQETPASNMAWDLVVATLVLPVRATAWVARYLLIMTS